MYSFFDCETWRLLTPAETLEGLQSDKEKSDVHVWRNDAQQISPLNCYKLLKGRFGSPNGTSMLFRKESTDNLIHWHYSFKAAIARIDFWGKSSGLEITLILPKGTPFEKQGWQELSDNINNSYQYHHKEMAKASLDLEKWYLFINPYARLHETIDQLLTELEGMDLNDITDFEHGAPEEERKKYYARLEQWIKRIDRAKALGTTIRMLCPVLGESFINLLILVFEKDEFREDKLRHDSFVRENINERIKNLYYKCNFFEKEIDEMAEAYKGYLRVMNHCNDLLHGNVNPQKLKVEDVFFDDKHIPLFKADEPVKKNP